MTNIRILIIVFVIILVNLPKNAICVNSKTIRMATEDWPPYANSKSLEKPGVAIEIISKAFQNQGYQVKFDFISWSRVLKYLEDGEYDVGGPAYFTKERGGNYAYSDPVLYSKLVFIKKTKNKIIFNKLDDLRPYRIGYVFRYAYTDEFDNADFLKKIKAYDDNTNIKKLINGRKVDIVVIDKSVADYLLENYFSKQLDEVEFMKPYLAVKPLFLIFSKKTKNYKKYLMIFNKGLNNIIESGEKQKIINKYNLK